MCPTAQEVIDIHETANAELRAKLQSNAQDAQMALSHQRSYLPNEEELFILKNDPGFQYYDDTECAETHTHYSQPLMVSTLTRTVQYEFAPNSVTLAQKRASPSPSKTPWYKRSRVRTSTEPASFQTGLQLLTAQEHCVEEL